MTFIGTKTQPPVNQSKTGHYKATRLHLSSRWHKTQSDVSSEELSASRLDNFSVKLFLIHSFWYCSFCLPLPFPCIPSPFWWFNTSCLFSPPLSPSNDSFLYFSLPPFIPQPDEVRVQLGYKQPLQAIHSDLITQHCRVKCLHQFHNYPSSTSPSYFLVTTGSSKQLGGQLF